MDCFLPWFRHAFRYKERYWRVKLWKQHHDRRFNLSQVLENVLPTRTRTYRLIVGEFILFVFLHCVPNTFLCSHYEEYLVELIYGRSVMTRAPVRMDKVKMAADRSDPVTEGSASPAAKTRMSGDWRVMRGKDCECTASTMLFRYIFISYK